MISMERERECVSANLRITHLGSGHEIGRCGRCSITTLSVVASRCRRCFGCRTHIGHQSVITIIRFGNKTQHAMTASQLLLYLAQIFVQQRHSASKSSYVSKHQFNVFDCSHQHAALAICTTEFCTNSTIGWRMRHCEQRTRSTNNSNVVIANPTQFICRSDAQDRSLLLLQS